MNILIFLHAVFTILCFKALVIFYIEYKVQPKATTFIMLFLTAICPVLNAIIAIGLPATRINKSSNV